MTKSTWAGKGLFQLSTFRGYAIPEGSQDRSSRKNLEEKTEVEAMEACAVLAYSQWFAQLAFLYHPGTGIEPPLMSWALLQ